VRARTPTDRLPRPERFVSVDFSTFSAALAPSNGIDNGGDTVIIIKLGKDVSLIPVFAMMI